VADAATYRRRLAEARDIDVAAVAAALRTAAVRDVRAAIAVSAASPFPRPPWMPEDAYRDTVRLSLEDDMSRALVPASERFWRACESRRAVGAWMEISHALWRSLWPAVRAWAHGSFPPGVGGRVQECIEKPVALLLGFILVGDTDGARMLAPLVALLPTTLPVARSKADPGTWIALGA
jgi:hypothetical protein